MQNHRRGRNNRRRCVKAIWHNYRASQSPDMLSYLDRQLTPAAAAQTAADNVSKTLARPASWAKAISSGQSCGPTCTPWAEPKERSTTAFGIDPYKVIYTYDQFEDFSDHPRRAHPILDAHGQPTGKVSDASGWPQFISTTWDKTVADNPFWYDGPIFQPANQDLAFSICTEIRALTPR